MELFLLYVWLKINSVITIFQISGAILLVSTIVMSIGYRIDKDIYGPTKVVGRWPIIKKLIIGTIVSGILAGTIPTKTDIAVLVGASYALDFARSPEGQKVKTIIVGKANEILDAEIRKLQGESR